MARSCVKTRSTVDWICALKISSHRFVVCCSESDRKSLTPNLRSKNSNTKHARNSRKQMPNTPQLVRFRHSTAPPPHRPTPPSDHPMLTASLLCLIFSVQPRNKSDSFSSVVFCPLFILCKIADFVPAFSALRRCRYVDDATSIRSNSLCSPHHRPSTHDRNLRARPSASCAPTLSSQTSRSKCSARAGQRRETEVFVYNNFWIRDR